MEDILEQKNRVGVEWLLPIRKVESLNQESQKPCRPVGIADREVFARPDSLESMYAKAISHFWHIFVAKAIYICTFGRFLSQKNNLRTLYGMFLPVKFCRPERFDFLWPQLEAGL